MAPRRAQGKQLVFVNARNPSLLPRSRREERSADLVGMVPVAAVRLGPCETYGFGPGLETSPRSRAGRVLRDMGPNGAARSVISDRRLPRRRGSRSVMGHEVRRDFRAARRAVGIVPQEVVFDPFFSVRETLEFQSGYFGLRRNGPWIDELLERLALAPKARANMRSLSGGMKRRVMVAQALVHRPPVIVLDSPRPASTWELRRTLWEFVAAESRGPHHRPHQHSSGGQQLCSRIAMMREGRIVALDSTERLLAAFPSACCGQAEGRPFPPGSPPERSTRAADGGACRSPTWLTWKTRWRLARAGVAVEASRSPNRAGGRVREIMRREAAVSQSRDQGFPTLLRKESCLWKVSFQTVAAPVLTTLLYLLVFSHALAGHVQAFPA